MRLRYNDCEISIGKELIRADFRPRLKMQYWEIALRDEVIYIRWDGKQEECFEVSKIEEIQFVMGVGRGRGNWKPTAYVFLRMKTETYPKDFFHLTIAEQYTFWNKTKAYHFCETVVNHIARKYGIPTKYKHDIETKGKWKGAVLAFVIMAISMFFIWLRLKFSK
jgi:hypothetical protein